MRASTVNEIKQELQTLKAAELISLCLRLARFKKENKELLTYLLYEANDEDSYTRGIQSEIEELFGTINHSQLYFAKKTLRKIVRVINKYSRYSGNKQTDIDLRLFFCMQLKNSGIPIRQNTMISNIFDSQLKKIRTNLSGLHEDLQHDYEKDLAALHIQDDKNWALLGPKKKK